MFITAFFKIVHFDLFSIFSPAHLLKAFQASLNIFQKKNRKKESRYEVLTKKIDQKETE
jgi:hypothetical protein